MILRVACKECRDTWRDARLRWMVVLVASLCSVAVVVGYHIATRRTAEIAAAEAEQRVQWLHRRVSNTHVAAHAGTTLFRPPAPLSVIDQGVDAFVGTSVFLEPHRRGVFAHALAERTAIPGDFPELTAAFILQLLAPLAIVLMTYGAFVEERERGTLQHVLSLGVRPMDLAIGKALGLTAPLLFVVLPALGISLLALRTAAGFSPARALALLAGYLAYFLTWTALSVAVSARARSSRGALALLLGLWLTTSVLLPRVCYTLAAHLAPVPTPGEFLEAMERADAAEAAGFMEDRARIERRLLEEYGVRTAAELPVSTWGVTLYEREQASTARYNARFTHLFDAYARQQRAVDALSMMAPAQAIRIVSMAMAGTDVAHFRDFAEAAERYRYDLVQRMNQVAIDSRLYNSTALLAVPPDRSAFPEGERAAYDSVAPFVYEAPGIGWVLARVPGPLLSLAGWLVVAGTSLMWALRDVATV